MTRDESAPERRVLLFTLAVVTFTPILLLLYRASATSWQYPALLPSQLVGERLSRLLFTPTVWSALGASVLLASATGMLSTAFAFVASRALARSTPTVRRIAAAAAFLPVIAPPIALGVGVQIFALRAGLAGGFAGVLLAHLVPASGYLTLFFLGVFQAYDFAMEDEARTLGASSVQRFVRITLPVLRPRLIEAMLLGALVSWGQVALTLLVGGGVVRTLPVELLAFVRAGDDQLAAAAAIILTVPPALALGLLQGGVRQSGAAA